MKFLGNLKARGTLIILSQLIYFQFYCRNTCYECFGLYHYEDTVKTNIQLRFVSQQIKYVTFYVVLVHPH